MRASLTASRSAQGGYEESYFFNYTLTGMAWKYYPFQNDKWEFHGDIGMANVLTKNRYLNAAGEQEFFHKYGIGLGGGFGISYCILDKSNGKRLGLDLYYERMNTRVEANGLGDDNWSFGPSSIKLNYNF